ncbi:MAG: FAD-dependent oxidoreductase [Candidatus Rokubacteria bacterium]|nr:FAD-dependent oxidoreductase [Candidatus Rokubacteria bacterium]
MDTERPRALVLGGGLAGLSAAWALTRAGRSAWVLERNAAIGGLARTAARGAFRFDLGGHRFHTPDGGIEALVRRLLGAELLTVPRRSQILLGARYVDYPLRPLNALAGVGARATCAMLADYALQRLGARLSAPRMVSLEDWVVRGFGRAAFDLYFKGYTEKIWGLGADRISMEWVAQRIQGLSLGVALRTALLGSRGPQVATLAEEFLYPPAGIGRIAERLGEEIEPVGRLLTATAVEEVEHDGSRVRGVTARASGRSQAFEVEELVSTIPLTSLVGRLRPRAPAEVLEAAARLRYRDLVIVAVMVDRRRVTDQTWIYVPDRRVPFSRIHEPTNWSAQMAPPGQTLLVTEHFCFRGDDTWRTPDERLSEVTIAHLARLGFLGRREVLDSAVVRVPRAYPLFEVGYEAPRRLIRAYLGRLRNLHLAGRAGAFAYMNMDQAMASGLGAAAAILSRGARGNGAAGAVPALASLTPSGASA